MVARGDCTEPAAAQAGLSKTEPADVGDKVGLDGAVVAGCGNHGDHVRGGVVRIGVLSHGEPYAAADDLPFLVYAAAVLGLGPGAYLVYNLLGFLCIQFSFPGKSADLPENEML